MISRVWALDSNIPTPSQDCSSQMFDHELISPRGRCPRCLSESLPDQGGAIAQRINFKTIPAAVARASSPRFTRMMRVPPNFSLVCSSKQEVIVKRFIPRLVVVLSLVILAQVARAQNSPSDSPQLDNAKSAGPATESLPELVRRVKASVVSVLTYDAKDEA